MPHRTEEIVRLRKRVTDLESELKELRLELREAHRQLRQECSNATDFLYRLKDSLTLMENATAKRSQFVDKVKAKKHL